MHTATHTPSPLSAALPAVQPHGERWAQLLRTTERAGRADCALRADAQDLARPLWLTVTGAGGRLSLALDAGQWPELAALAPWADALRRDAAARLVLGEAQAALHAAGCAFEGCEGLGQLPRAPGVATVHARLGGFDLDLHPDAGADPLARSLGRGPVVAPHWPLATRVQFGVFALAPQRLAALRPGDALICDARRAVTLCVGDGTAAGRHAAARLDQHGHLTMTEPFAEARTEPPFERFSERVSERVSGRASEGFAERSHGNDEDPWGSARPTAPHEAAVPHTARPLEASQAVAPGAPTADRIAALSALPLTLMCEIDGPVLSVAAAAALGAGDVLELPVAADEALVRLRCQGRVIGVGRLVTLGGQLAVRITDLGSPC